MADQQPQRETQYRRHSQGILFCLLVAWSTLCGITPQTLSAQEKQVNDGMFITVPNPITEKAVNLVEHKIKHAVGEQNRKNIRTIVFDFTPSGEKAATSDPWMCMKLKNLIKDLELGRVNGISAATTVAFVHGEASRHSLLPILACNQLIMSESSTLGPVLQAGDASLPKEVHQAYFDLAKPKGAEKLVKQMIGGQVVSTKEARAIKLCNEVYEMRYQLAEALELPPKSLRENWLAGREPLAAVVPLRQTVNADKLSSLQRRLKAAIRDGNNLIILELDCEGGDPQGAALFTEQFLKGKTDRDGFPLTTVAYIPPNRKLGAGTFIALGCSSIVMGENSALGEFSSLKDSDPQKIAVWRSILADLAKERYYPPLLFQATLDPSTAAYHVVSKGTLEHRLISKEQYEAEKQLWTYQGKLPEKEGKTVLIGTKLAHDWNVAQYTDVNSLEELYQNYRVDASEVREYRDDWLDRVAGFFRRPAVKIFLLLIGIAGLILEIKIPGFGVPGIIAALCFVLFFWSHSFVNQFTMLAVFLFILGLILLALEVFVVPGFGVTGISGILLIAGSVVLVMVEQRPDTPQGWQEVGWSIGTFCVSVIGAIILAIAVASFLPQIPYANRLMLAPPEEEDGEVEHLDSTGMESLAPLLGAIGITETPLRPAGKARFGDEYVDVVSEGDYINPASRVQVIEIEGNRVVVKRV